MCRSCRASERHRPGLVARDLPGQSGLDRTELDVSLGAARSEDRRSEAGLPESYSDLRLRLGRSKLNSAALPSKAYASSFCWLGLWRYRKPISQCCLYQVCSGGQLWLELVAPPVFLSRSLARGCQQGAQSSKLGALVSWRRCVPYSAPRLETVCSVLRSQNRDGASRIPLPILKSMTWCFAALSARAPGRAQDGLGRAGSESRE